MATARKGLGPTQQAILDYLRSDGEPFSRLMAREVAEATGVRPSDAARIMNTLVMAGVVTRHSDRTYSARAPR